MGSRKKICGKTDKTLFCPSEKRQGGIKDKMDEGEISEALFFEECELMEEAEDFYQDRQED